jgi:integrase
MGAIHRLSTKQIERCGDGMHSDGGNLYLRRTGSAASWIFRYHCRITHQTHDLGIGKYPEVSLEKARKRAFDYRVKIADGVDVAADHKRARREAAFAAAPVAPTGYTFERAAAEYIASQEEGWVRESSAQWTQSMRDYVLPVIGKAAIDKVDTQHVLRVLKPIWTTKHVTAWRVRNRIERILDWAKANELRDKTKENPARWKGHMQHLLASGVHRVEEHEAVPVKAIPKFVAKVRAVDYVPARALEFLALTAVRRGEARLATFREFDLENKVWIIPAPRTKTGKRKKSNEPHVVPLCDRAVAIVEQQRRAAKDPAGYVFASERTGGPIAENRMREFMIKINGEGPSPHGLRSSFRDWCGLNGHPRELAELSLAHVFGNRTERSYRRDPLVEQRRVIMDAWAKYCGG